MESIKKASSIKLITILLSYVMAYLYVDQFYDLVKHKTVGAIVGTIIFTLKSSNEYKLSENDFYDSGGIYLCQRDKNCINGLNNFIITEKSGDFVIRRL